mmetsp:Transcript_73287/g.136963  ORF Transcript_73287/g.136963 Transcript_73287/m.136963 type:complete len:394 (-) Transcript_73287:86-1267(-)
MIRFAAGSRSPRQARFTAALASPRELAVYGAEAPVVLRPASQGAHLHGECRRCELWRARCEELEAQLSAARLASVKQSQIRKPSAGRVESRADANPPSEVRPPSRDVAVHACPQLRSKGCQAEGCVETTLSSQQGHVPLCDMNVQAGSGLACNLAAKTTQTVTFQFGVGPTRSQATQTRQWTWPKRDVACSAALGDEEQSHQRILLLQRIDSLLEECNCLRTEAAEAQNEKGRWQVIVQNMLCEREAPVAITQPGPYHLQQYSARSAWLARQRWVTDAQLDGRPSSAIGTAAGRKELVSTPLPAEEGRRMLSKTWIDFEQGGSEISRQVQHLTDSMLQSEKLPSVPAPHTISVATESPRSRGPPCTTSRTWQSADFAAHESTVPVDSCRRGTK